MALEQYFHEAVAQQDSAEEDVALIEKWKPVPAAIDGCENNLSGGFDCNICLDLVQEPVVTLCGHLYCWPCIYKWIHSQSISTEIPDHQSPQCPVCKAEVSQGTLVPLYGRGKSSEGKSPHLGVVVPRRPPSPTCRTTRSRPSLQIPARSYPQWSEPMPSLDGTTDSFHPTVGMYGEMVYARIFGSAENTYPDSYHLVGSNSPRVRRHIMQADKSLSRVCFFFSCCLVVCFLLF